MTDQLGFRKTGAGQQLGVVAPADPTTTIEGGAQTPQTGLVAVPTPNPNTSTTTGGDR